MRRLVLEDPFARSAVWSRNLAVFALIVAVIGVLLSRKGLDPQASLAIVGAALSLAGLAVLFAVVAMAVIWQTGFRGIGLALLGLALAAGLFAYPGYLAFEARTAPSLTDISTDAEDPPIFMATEKALAARRGKSPPPQQSTANRALQERLYPEIQSITLDAEADDVDIAIHRLLKRRKWTIVDEYPPVNFATGHIDLVVKPSLMGFPADVTIRTRALGSKTQVDIRSVARAGWQERPGSNGARVEQLVSDIQDAIGES